MANTLNVSGVKHCDGERVDLGDFSEIDSFSRPYLCCLRPGDAVGEVLAGIRRIGPATGPEVVRGAKPIQGAVDRLVGVLRGCLDCLDLQVRSFDLSQFKEGELSS